LEFFTCSGTLCHPGYITLHSVFFYISNLSYPIELDVEYADKVTFSKMAYLSKVIDLYQYKYKFSKQKVDLVLVIGNESADLMLEYSEVLFGDIPVVLITLEQKNVPRNLLKPNMVSSVYGFDLAKMRGAASLNRGIAISTAAAFDLIPREARRGFNATRGKFY
jgi:hypothetical protein